MGVFRFFFVVIPISIILPGVWWFFVVESVPQQYQNLKHAGISIVFCMSMCVWVCVSEWMKRTNHHLTKFNPTVVVNLMLPPVSLLLWSIHTHQNEISCVSLPFCQFTIFYSQIWYGIFAISHSSGLYIGTSKYQMFSLSTCTVLTHSHQICFRFRFSDCDRSFSISWTMSEKLCIAIAELPYVRSFSLLSLSTICLSMSLRLIYLPHSVCIFFLFRWRCVRLCRYWIDELRLPWSKRMKKKNSHYLYSEWSTRCRSIRQRLMKCTR